MTKYQESTKAFEEIKNRCFKSMTKINIGRATGVRGPDGGVDIN